MDAKQRLDQLYSNPPAPNMEAYPDVCLAPLIRSMRITGVFFDAFHYSEAKQILDQRFAIDANQESAAAYPTTPLDQEEQIAVVVSGEDIDNDNDNNNFVPSLLKHPNGIVDDRDLAKLLCTAGKSSKSSSKPVDKDGLRKGLVNTTMRPAENPGISGASSRNLAVTLMTYILNKWLRGGRFYALLVTSIFWANTLRCLPYLLGSPLISLVVTASAFLSFLKVAISSTLLLVSCWRRSYFSAFFINWRLLFADLTTRRLGLRGLPNTTNIKLVLAIFWMTAVSNAFIMPFIFLFGSDMGGIGKFYNLEIDSKILSGIVSTVLMTYSSVGWISPVMLIVVLCRHITAHFNHFRDVFKLHIEAAEGRFPPHFRELRERHLIMCNLITMLDKYMRMALAVLYSTNILMACLLLYQMIDDMTIVSQWAGWLVGLFLCLFNVVFLTYNACKVKTSMHAVIYELQTMPTNSITLDQQTQFQVFMSKLNDPELGFTVLGKITVRKELIFTLLGLYMTYAFVLLQFK